MPVSRIANTPAQAIHQRDTTHAQVTVSSTAGTLATLGSFTYHASTTHVLVQFNGADARVTFDGATDPTASLGFLYVDGREAYWPIQLAKRAILLRGASTDVTVEVQELNYGG